MIKSVFNTDAPPLPAGYMYRVKRKALGYVVIELREKRLFGSKELSSVVLFPHEYSGVEDLIAHGCEIVIDRANEAFDASGILNDASEYVGDHLSLEDK